MKNHVSRFHRSPINTAIILNIQSDPYSHFLGTSLAQRAFLLFFPSEVIDSHYPVLTYHLCNWGQAKCATIRDTMLHNYDDCLSEPFHAQNIRSNTYVKHEILIYSIKLILFELRARIINCSFTCRTKIETHLLY